MTASASGASVPWRRFSSLSSSSPSTTTTVDKDVEISPATHGTKPLLKFVAPELDSRLVKILQAQGITQPTPIQAYGIPLVREG